ncbi:MAG: CocE/NonD family hydrolase [Promethearchaeota archaeon]
MIDWIIASFYFLNNLEFLTLEHMFAKSLILLALCRGFYIITYFFTYLKKYSSETNENIQIFSTKEKTYFGIKQLLIFLFGMIFFPISVFISIYSLIISGYYLKTIAEHKRNRMIKVLGKIIIVLTPIIGILWFSFIEVDYYSLGAVGLSLLAFLNYGLRVSKLSILEIMEKFTRRRLQKLPKIAQYIFLLILIALPTTLIVGTAIYTPQSKFTVMVPMRDDVKLATDVYFAPGSFGTPRPVILIRTTYGKNYMGELYGMLYLTQNYHVVMQDCRGTFDSPAGDKFLLFTNAYKDGVDTINWILDQSWCNGKIASSGASALGLNQFFYAGMNPEGLVSQSLMVATPDLYKTSIYQGGAFRESTATEWARLTAPDNYLYQLEQLTDHSLKDKFYNSTSMFMNIGPTFENVSVSAIHIGGWYDLFQQGTLDGYIGYDDYGLPTAQSKQLLIMGPFTHGFPTEGQQGELFFPTKSVSASNLYLEWEQKIFDHTLLGTQFDWTGNRVAYYMMGDLNDQSSDVNDYRFAKDWPLPHENDTWYFDIGEDLLNNSLPLTNANYSYLYDPRNPVPTLGGTNLLIPSGPYDQRSIENRTDVLLFESSILASPYETIGHMWAHLYVKSNCTNTDFTIKISDVYPNGESILISDGIINAVRRDGFNSTAPDLNGVEFAEVDIDLWSTAYKFNTGHKIRIVISSSNYPRFATNPNTGAPQEIYSYQYLQKYIANNTILIGPDYPSHIILPRPI